MRQISILLLTVCCTAIADSRAEQLSRQIRPDSLTVEPQRFELPDRWSRRQLLVTGRSGEYDIDLTRDVTFESLNESVAKVDERGVVLPVGRGTTRILIRLRKATVESTVTVGDLRTERPVSYTNDVMAVIARAGCNSGSCHGHSSGKGGFKLSFRGYDLAADHKALTDPDSGRVDLETPDDSLILQMPTARLEHGGGLRFKVDSTPYWTLRCWIEAGAKSDVGRAAKVERIEVVPGERTLPEPGLKQQLSVLAHFSDGRVRDITHQASFELSNEGSIEVDADGFVTSVAEGEAAVFVRFLGNMAISRFLVIRHKPNLAWTPMPERNFLDRHVNAKLKRIQVLPSHAASDAEFLRRVSLKVIGVPPGPDEVRAFLASDDADKRQRKIDELIEREEFGQCWAMYWIERSGSTESGDSARFKAMWMMKFWLEDVINRNLPYDQFVRQAIAGRGSSIRKPGMTFATNNLARQETVPQLFLGVRLQCAECHDHPFDVWRQADYQALGQFFEGLGYKEGSLDPSGRDIRRFVKPENLLPWNRDNNVTLRLLDGSEVAVPVSRDRRDVLVDWMFGPAKKLTARAIANRVWGRLFGRGIVDPVDDMRFSNPAVNQPLLDALADDFIVHRYDFKHLVRTILNSQTWQLSSETNPTNADERMNFSHFYPHRLSAETLLDSIGFVTGSSEKFRIGPPGMRAVNLPYVNIQSRFLTTFGRPADRTSACECVRDDEATLSQMLHLCVNDRMLERMRDANGHLARLLGKDATNQQLVESLYLRVISRFPTKAEREFATRYLTEAESRQHAAEDIMWALVNSREFMLHH